MTDTSTRPEPVRLTDLADPEFSPDARAIIDAVGGMAADVELNGDAAHDRGGGPDRARRLRADGLRGAPRRARSAPSTPRPASPPWAGCRPAA